MTVDGERNLEVACAAGNLDQIRMLLENMEKATDQEAKKSKRAKPITAMRAAIAHDQSSVVSLLLNEGFLFDYQCVKIAMEHENVEILQEFFNKQRRLNRPLFHTMRMPLSHALKSECLTHWFLDCGADPNASVPGWPSPMNSAAMRSSLPTIKLLREYGGCINHGVIQSAAKTTDESRVEISEYLLQEGANIDELEYEWDQAIFRTHWARAFGTALHHAAKRGNREMVKFLLEHGARQDIKDSKKMTAMQCAEENGHAEIVNMLRNI
ncbi:MAG: hypothetical protein Q9219_001603 [cf. Caloplaca sp. 3 TL-2023]